MKCGMHLTLYDITVRTFIRTQYKKCFMIRNSAQTQDKSFERDVSSDENESID